MWVWVNTHGSFPLGHRPGGPARRPAAGSTTGLVRRVELRVLGWTAVWAPCPGGHQPARTPDAGLPLGPAPSIERPSPTWPNGNGLSSTTALSCSSPCSWSSPWCCSPSAIVGGGAILPTVAFGAVRAHQHSQHPPGQRGTDARSWPRRCPAIGSVRGERPAEVAASGGPLRSPCCIALVAVEGLGQTANTALDGLPAAGVAAGCAPTTCSIAGDRVVSHDWVGNYLEFRYGPDQVRVFIDDRVDMYPPAGDRRRCRPSTSKRADYQRVLVDQRASAVLWERSTPLGRWLGQDLPLDRGL